MKNIIIFIISIFFAFPLFGEDSKEGIVFNITPNVMNVLTMNLHCFKDDWEFRLSNILIKVAELSPDVIAFQEVCENPKTKESQIKYIQNFLLQSGYPLKSIEAQFTHPAWEVYDEFIVLISKRKISAIDKGFLPRSLLQRGYIGFNISNRWYINTHLEFRADNLNFRKEQIIFLTDRFINQAHLITGDFNSSPEDSEQDTFKKKDYLSFFPGATHNGDDGNSRNNIDGFWFSPLLHSNLNSLSGSILFKEKIKDKYLSDHFAVMTYLEFKN